MTTNNEEKDRSLKRWGYLVTFATALAVAAPMLIPDAEDSFPLSTYPMFARKRGSPRIYQVVGVTEERKEHKLGPKLLGTREVLQAKVLISRASKRGRESRRKLCERVAKNVVAQSNEDTWLKDITEVRIQRVRFHPIEYFTKTTEPISRQRLFRCKVPWETKS